VHYDDEEAVAMDYAAADNEELRDIAKAGIDVLQLRARGRSTVRDGA
jgi:methionine synthase II (cobalamin-independent)